MQIDDLKRVNRLWAGIYPYLASQIMEDYRRDSGAVLELGPFSGGISLHLSQKRPDMRITIAEESQEVLTYLSREFSQAGASPHIKFTQTPLDRLVFDDAQFDLAVFRGAFFFLHENATLLREIFRVLKEKGTAIVGGGFGRETPQALIDEIADESRILNDRLGRRRVSIDELKEMAERSGLRDYCRIEERGGLWLIINKGKL